MAITDHQILTIFTRSCPGQAPFCSKFHPRGADNSWSPRGGLNAGRCLACGITNSGRFVFRERSRSLNIPHGTNASTGNKCTSIGVGSDIYRRPATTNQPFAGRRTIPPTDNTRIRIHHLLIYEPAHTNTHTRQHHHDNSSPLDLNKCHLNWFFSYSSSFFQLSFIKYLLSFFLTSYGVFFNIKKNRPRTNSPSSAICNAI